MRNSKGFTLVELAVVLVIIGIILGAVIKGQDLIDNARAKQFTNNIKTWQITLSAYYDRKGRYPGDADKNGIIGDGDPKTDIVAAKFTGLPQDSDGNTINTFTMGQNTYYVKVGNDGAVSPATPKNIIKICASADCATVFNTEALKMAEAFNTAMTGSADATGTIVYGVTAAGTVDDTKWLVTGAGTKASGNTDWLTFTTITGIVYVLQ